MMSHSSQKILVVDDDPGVVKLVESILTNHGYIVSTAFNGQEALEKVKKEQPDLIVLDIMMPGINGYDVCYQLRFNKQYPPIPILLLTSREKEMASLLERKMNIEYIQKPADTKALLARIATLLKSSEGG